jgi:hypothetical protein
MEQTWLMPYGPPPTPRGSRASKASRVEESPAQESGDKTVRVTVDLTPADYQVLNVWLARASLELDQPVSSMTLARGIRAMIQAAAGDQVVSAAVLDVMRKEQP